MGYQKDMIVISEADNDTFESTAAAADHVIEIVLENILFFLTSRLDRNAASLVCKLWYRVEALTRSEVFIGNCYSVSPQRTVERFLNVNSVVLKGKPRFADFNMLPFDWGAHFTPWANSFAVAYSWLQKLYLKRMTIMNEDLSILATSFSAIQELVFVCCDGFGTSGLALVANKCRKLRVLDMIDDDVSDDDVDWVSCFPEDETCLESLGFDCVESLVPFDSLERLVARSPMLKKLKLNRHVLMGELNCLMIRAPQLTHLGTGSFGELDMINLDVLTEYTSTFAASKSLECLSGFREMDPVFLPAIHPICSNLTSLNFSSASISFLQLKPIISQCHKLQTFWALDSVCDEGLAAVASTCRDLRELRIFPIEAREDFEVSVSEVGLEYIAEGCPNLESILYFCQRMTNSALIKLANNCPRISVFRLCIMGRQRPDCVTGEPMDEGFGSVVRHCTGLTRLAVSGLLTDRAFFYIGSHGKSLRTLSIAFAGDTDVSMIYILEGCQNLQKLEIRDSPFGDMAVFSGIHHFYNMRFVWMSSSRCTIEGCREVARALPRLVVEVIDEGETEPVSGFFQILYLYRSLEGPRGDLPTCVTIL